MSDIGTESRPLRVAIVGSGPSGFFAAAALLASDRVCDIDLFDRLPTPFGLVRGGVAPDHQKIKSVVRAFTKTAQSPHFRFLGNVEIGRDVPLDALRTAYDQVVLAIGAESARSLGIPGEQLAGSYDATSFVGWYNGHPAFQSRDYDLSGSTAVIVGVGNVAMDVTRVLAQSPARLADTDITAAALEALEAHQISDIYVLGRRGPAQAAFSPAEIKEIESLEGVDLVVRPEDAEVDPLSAAWLEQSGDRQATQNVAFLQEIAGRPTTAPRRVHLRLHTSPHAYSGAGKVEQVEVGTNRIVARSDGRMSAEDTGQREILNAQFVLRSVGYRGVPLPGAPFDDRTGTVPNQEGRVVDGAAVVPGLYVVGWAKRGPSGLIGSNRADSKATVQRMLEDVPGLPSKPAVRLPIARSVGWADWEALDRIEIDAGQAKGKIREKITRVEAMLAALEGG